MLGGQRSERGGAWGSRLHEPHWIFLTFLLSVPSPLLTGEAQFQIPVLLSGVGDIHESASHFIFLNI